MKYAGIKKDDLIMNFSAMSEVDQQHLSNLNFLRRKLFLELETIPGVKEVFEKYNVFFVEDYDNLNRINIDFPREDWQWRITLKG